MDVKVVRVVVNPIGVAIRVRWMKPAVAILGRLHNRSNARCRVVATFSRTFLSGNFTPKERTTMAADRAPVALCGEYAGLKFSERKYRVKDPQDDSRR